MKNLLLILLLTSSAIANAGNCFLNENTTPRAVYDARVIKEVIEYKYEQLRGDFVESQPDTYPSQLVGKNKKFFLEKDFESMDECLRYSYKLDWDDPAKVATNESDTIRHHVEELINTLRSTSVKELEEIFKDRREEFKEMHEDNGFKLVTTNTTKIEGKGLVAQFLFEVYEPVEVNCSFYNQGKLIGIENAKLNPPTDQIKSLIQGAKSLDKTECVAVGFINIFQLAILLLFLIVRKNWLKIKNA